MGFCSLHIIIVPLDYNNVKYLGAWAPFPAALADTFQLNKSTANSPEKMLH